MTTTLHKALIGMGSNVGERVATCCAAIDQIRKHDSIMDVRVSPFYETAPVGVTDQPSFINLVLKITTSLDPLPLLRVLKAMEQALGRVPRYRWGPRELDLDILLYDDITLSTDTLTIPHPEMHRRAFVLVPASDIAGDWYHPLLKLPLLALLKHLSTADVVRYQGPVPCV